MSDLTVLVSPTPLYPRQNPLGFNFARRSQNDLSRPVMVTLESVDPDEDGPHSPVEVSSLNEALLSPPRRTYKAPRTQSQPPQRPASAPPLTPQPTTSSDSHNPLPIAHIPRRVFSSSTPVDRSELSRPPPPLFRPTTFWRKTKRSGVTGASYSPSSHLIRRSTFVAAGLSLDRPEADISALGVESRVKLIESIVYIMSLGTRSTSLSNRFTSVFRSGAANRHRINQAIPSVSSTSYDYWWPYSAAEDAPASTASLAATSSLDSDTATNTQETVLSGDIPSASLIQITALLPTTTSPQAVLPKLPYGHQVNILYLIPLFVALGVVLGAISVVILLNWRRRFLRTSTLRPGPPYVPSENDVEDRLLVHGYPSMEQVSLLAASTPSKFTVHGSRYKPTQIAWRTADTTRTSYSQSTYTQTIIPSNDGERFTVVAGEDPFALPDPVTIQEPPVPASDVSSMPTIRLSPSSSETIGRDNSTRHQAQDNILPKPFRRSMFDILKLKGPCRRTLNARMKYTALAPDGEGANKVSTHQMRRASSSGGTLGASESHLRTVRRPLGGVLNVGEVHSALGLLYFESGTFSIPTQGERPSPPRVVTSFTVESSNGSPVGSMDGENHPMEESEEETGAGKYSDVYTKAPRRRGSRTPQRNMSTGGASRRYSAPDTHMSVLPLSPPSLMSQPLEKSLFLTSPSSSSVSLASRANSIAAIDSSHLHSTTRSPDSSFFPLPSRKTKAKRKLRTGRPEPPLPYPSYPDRDRVQPTPQEQSASVSLRRRSVSPGSPSPTGHPIGAAQRQSTTGISSLGSLSPTSLAVALASSSSSDMLSKVNDIVAQGYVKRRASTKEECESVEENLDDPV